MATSTVPLWQRDLQQQLDYRDQTQYRNLATLIETCTPGRAGHRALHTTLSADPSCLHRRRRMPRP